MKKFFCGLFGHHVRRVVRAWYVEPRYHTVHVADEIVEECFSCLCKEEEADWAEVDRSGINSLTMGSDRWALLRRDGKIPAYTV